MRSPASTDHIAHELEGLRPELDNEDECEEVRDVDARNVRQAQLTKPKEIQARNAQEAEEAIARQRARDKAARAFQQPPPSPSKTAVGSSKRPLTRPAPTHSSSSSSTPLTGRQSSQTNAPSAQHGPFAGFPTGRAPPIGTQKPASATIRPPSIWGRLSTVVDKSLTASPEPQTPTGRTLK